jgi:hypothetical protein
MGKSRSGRKAWRGIDASAVEDAVATAASRAKSGADVASLPDAALFFVDATAAAGARPVCGSASGTARSISRRSRQRGCLLARRATQPLRALASCARCLRCIDAVLTRCLPAVCALFSPCLASRLSPQCLRG